MQTNIELQGLRVAVTGGTSGLGLALVRQLAAMNACVAFVARTAANVERIADETGAHGIVGDVGKKEDIYPIALQVTASLGGLDVLRRASALSLWRSLPIPSARSWKWRSRSISSARSG